MNYPEIMNILEILKRYRDLHSYSNAQLANMLTPMGWTYTESYLNELFIGQKRMTEKDEEYFKLFLLQEIFDATTMT